MIGLDENLERNTVAISMLFPAELEREETKAFLTAIRAEPNEDGPRLIFADWLDDKHDPRADMIRLSCELERTPRMSIRWCQRYQQLKQWLDQFKDEWLGPLAPPFVLISGIRRGLLQLRICSPDNERICTQIDLSELSRAAESGWIGSVNFAGCPQALLNLRHDWPLVESVLFLSVRGSQHVREHHLESLIGLKQLSALDLHWCVHLSDAVWDILVRLDSIKDLRLTCTSMTDAGLSKLGHLQSLQNLELQDGENIAGFGFESLVSLANLTHLSLSGFRQLNALTLKRLAKIPHLRHLELFNCPILSAQSIMDLKKSIPHVIVNHVLH